MCKTIRNQFDKHLNFEEIFAAFERAADGKRTKPEVINFTIDLETNLDRILLELENGTYQFGAYRTFKIYEPKERIIKSLPFRDRIVHQWYVESFIKNYFFPRFITNTFACLDGRGTHKCAKKMQKLLKKANRLYGDYYILKCDVKKYFYSIDKNVLRNILKKYIKDDKILKLTDKILEDGEDIGIPIGNYTSQFFANVYLNELDHYIYDDLNIKLYIRYMDDFVLLLKTKNEARETLRKIDVFLNAKLHLKLNNKSRYFPRGQGVNFCGFIIYEKFMLLRKSFKKKFDKTIKVWNKLLSINKLDTHKMLLVFNSIKGHAGHSNSYNYICKQKEKIKEMLNINLEKFISIVDIKRLKL